MWERVGGGIGFAKVKVYDRALSGAAYMTLIVSCCRRGINPQDYLTDILKRLPELTINQIDPLLPENWKPPPAAPPPPAALGSGRLLIEAEINPRLAIRGMCSAYRLRSKPGASMGKLEGEGVSGPQL